MKRANVLASNATNTVIDGNASVLAKCTATSNTKRTENQQQQQGSTTGNNNDETAAYYTSITKYEELLTFIQGSLLVGSNEAGDMDVGDDGSVCHQNQDYNQFKSTPTASARPKIPTMQDVARGKGSKYNLDDKRYFAYQIVCCTILLQLVTEGDLYDTKLGEMLGATLDPLAETCN